MGGNNPIFKKNKKIKHNKSVKGNKKKNNVTKKKARYDMKGGVLVPTTSGYTVPPTPVKILASQPTPPEAPPEAKPPM